MTARIFIDGVVGTTGLQIKSRLKSRGDIELVTLAEDVRKDAKARADMLNSVDVAILCLPDAAAVEAAAMVTNTDVKIIDASSAHRIADNWAYGFPELSPGQRDIIRHATRVSNPGCYAVASVSMLQPLVAGGLIDADQGLSINAISGYSGGGKPLIADFEGGTDSNTPFYVYGLGLAHKHVPEIQKHGGLNVRPIMVPSVGHFAQGMIVQLPLFADASAVYDVLASHYEDSQFVNVVKANDIVRIEPQALNGTNELRLHVCEALCESGGQTVVMALLDNLGKGASGSCVQNLNIMLGVDEDLGL